MYDTIIHCLKTTVFKPTMADTVKSRERNFSVNQSTFRDVLQNITACVISAMSNKSYNVSNLYA